MSLLALIPLSLGLGLLGLGAFFWALRNGQFEDPDGAAWRIILPDNPPEMEGKTDDLVAHAEDRHARRGL